jgi:hypothetical protein
MKHHSVFVTTALLFTVWNAQAQVADAGPDPYLCGTDYDMFANVPTVPGTGMWHLITGCGTVVDPLDPFTPVVGLCPGENVWQWTIIDDNGATGDLVTITIFDEQAPDADAGPDIEIELPMTSAQLQASGASPPMLCTWTIVSGSGTINNPNDPNTTVTGLSVGNNVFRWTCDNGPCGNTMDDVVIGVSEFTGIQEQGAGLNWLRYDPSTKELSLNTGENADQLTVQDISGRMVGDLANGARMWSLVGEPAGVYIAKAKVNGTTHVLRFVVQ